MLAEFRQNFCRHCSPWEACLNTFNSGSLRSFKAINFKRQFSEWHLDVELVQRGWTPWKQTKAGTLRWKRQKDYLKWRFPPYTRNFLVLICNYFWKWQHLKEKYRKDNITNTREATIYIYKNDAKTTEKLPFLLFTGTTGILDLPVLLPYLNSTRNKTQCCSLF